MRPNRHVGLIGALALALLAPLPGRVVEQSPAHRGYPMDPPDFPMRRSLRHHFGGGPSGHVAKRPKVRARAKAARAMRRRQAMRSGR